MEPAGHSALAAANADYKAIFQEFFGSGIPGIFQLFTEEIQVEGDAVSLPITTSIPQMETWVGDKIFNTLRQYMFTLDVVPHAANLELKRLKVDTDKTGTIGHALRTFLGRQVQAMDKLVIAKLLANPVGYDEVALLSNSHPHSNSTGDNLTTDAISHTAVRAMHSQMMAFEDEDGENWGVNPRVLLVGPSLEHEALEISGADKPIYFNASGAEATSSVVGGVVIENVSKGRYEVVVSQRITGTQWFLIDPSKPGAKPIVSGVYRSFEPHTQAEMDSHGRFMSDDYRYSLEGDVGFGAGLWQTIGGKIAA